MPVSRRVSPALVLVLLVAACGDSSSTASAPPAAGPPGGAAPPETVQSPEPPPPSPAITRLALRDRMRELWQDHVAWTRIVIIDAVAGLPDTTAAVGRLLQNQADIGDAIKPFYGQSAGEQLSALLRDHINIAVELVTAAKGGETARLDEARARWNANADQIAAFLAGANPGWAAADLQAMMRTHLEQTLAEATARLRGDWEGDIAAYDAIVPHILELADTLTEGIATQLPDRVSGGEGSARDEELHLGMRALWQDHVIWTRTFIISAVAGLADADAAAARLLRNQADIGDAVKPFYGEAAGAALTALLRDHITIAAELVSAAKAGDTSKVEDAKARWSANADQIAVFLVGANPAWSVEDLKEMMHTHLEQTLAEATARLTGDWAADIQAYDGIVKHILAMADMLSQGINEQLPVAKRQR